MGASDSKVPPPLSWAASTAPCSDRNITWQYIHTRAHLSPPYTDCPNLLEALNLWSCEDGCCQPFKHLDIFQSLILHLLPTEFVKYAEPSGTWHGLGNPMVGRWEDGVWQVTGVGEGGQWEWERIGNWEDGLWKWVGENDWQKGWWQKGWWELTTSTGIATTRPGIKGNTTSVLRRRSRDLLRSSYAARSRQVRPEIQPYRSDNASAPISIQATKSKLQNQVGNEVAIATLLVLALLLTLGFNFWFRKKGRPQRIENKKMPTAELDVDFHV